MTLAGNIEIIALGGSTGSIPVLIRLIGALHTAFRVPILIVVHRMKNVESTLTKVLSAGVKVLEPDDKEVIREGMIYLAPQNYHMLVEQDRVISLDSSELVNYSRPSIDVTFMSVAAAYGAKAMAVLLSGANRDGVEGLRRIVRAGGRAIVQDPATAASPIMPQAAIESVQGVEICPPEKIIDVILNINSSV